MASLEDICQELQTQLARAEAECPGVLATLDGLDGFIDSTVAGIIGARLTKLRNWVAAQTKTMRGELYYPGYVFALLRESDGLTMHWALSKQGISRTFWLDRPDVEVLSAKEAIALLDRLLAEIDNGDCAGAIDWLRRYGKSPGLESGRFR